MNINSIDLITLMPTGLPVQEENCWTCTPQLINIRPISVEWEQPKGSAPWMEWYSYTVLSSAVRGIKNGCWLVLAIHVYDLLEINTEMLPSTKDQQII